MRGWCLYAPLPVDFDSSARQLTPLTHDVAQVVGVLGQMKVGGGTSMHEGLRAAWQTLASGDSSNLGQEPVTIARNGANGVVMERRTANSITYQFDRGRIQCIDNASGRSQDLTHGQSQVVGNDRITVKQA